MKNFLKSYSLIVVFAIVSTLIVVMFFYSRSLNEFFVELSDHNVRMRLAETGKHLAGTITAEELSAFTTAEDMLLPEYQELKKQLVEFAHDADVLYAYFLRLDDGMVQFIVDNDYDPETVVGLDTPPSDPGDFMPIIDIAMTGEVGVSELGQYIQGWEGLISAYVPMFDSHGNILAIAGVDIDDREIVHARTRVRILATMEMLAVIAVLFYGIFGFSKYRREAMAAKDANEAKSKFLSLISHEIRTPMNAILGITEILLRDETLSSDAGKGMEDIRDSGDLLLNIVNDILDMSKIEAGKMEIIPFKYDIPSMINDAVQVNKVRYESKPIDFKLDIDENTPLYFVGDEMRIKQILNNLLSNAYKYTEKGEICLTVRAEPKNGSSRHIPAAGSGAVTDADADADADVILVLEVSDTGQGMTEEELGRLFTEYTRFHQDVNRNTIGIGLGLNITRHLISMMGGVISVVSKVNEGTTFTVRIPQKRVSELVCGNKIGDKLRNFRYHSKVLSKRGVIIREYMPYGSVLVVDDVVSNVSVAKGLLTPYCLKVDTAGSGFEAIERIKAGNVYDVIFMDHMMPKMDGIETVKILREMGYKNCVVALSANALIGQADIFLENGFDAYVSKPIDSREMNRILNEFIRDKKPPDVVAAARQEYRQMLERRKNEAAEASGKAAEIPAGVAGISGAAADVRELSNGADTDELFEFDPDDILDDVPDDVTDSFIIDAERAIDTLTDLMPKSNNWNEKELNTYRITAHGMKSALYNIDEKMLSGYAYRLEQAAVDGDIDLVIAQTDAFIEELNSLIERLRGN